jgi:hypothetical protein
MDALENVFGHDVKVDAAGNPIETGIGALKAELHKIEKEVGSEIVHIVDPALVAERDDLKVQLSDEKALSHSLANEVMTLRAELAAHDIAATAVKLDAVLTVPDATPVAATVKVAAPAQTEKVHG